MSRKDISDRQVCEAYRDSARLRTPGGRVDGEWPYDLLAMSTGQAPKVCHAACERAYLRGFVDYGTSLRTGWLTDAGKALLEEK